MTELEKLKSDLQVIHTLIEGELKAIDVLLKREKMPSARDLEIAKHLFDIQRYSALTVEEL